MSTRYEFNTADCDLEIAGPGAELGADRVDDDKYALVIGDPWASAYAVEGSPTDLRNFVHRASDLVERMLPKDACQRESSISVIGQGRGGSD